MNAPCQIRCSITDAQRTLQKSTRELRSLMTGRYMSESTHLPLPPLLSRFVGGADCDWMLTRLKKRVTPATEILPLWLVLLGRNGSVSVLAAPSGSSDAARSVNSNRRRLSMLLLDALDDFLLCELSSCETLFAVDGRRDGDDRRVGVDAPMLPRRGEEPTGEPPSDRGEVTGENEPGDVGVTAGPELMCCICAGSSSHPARLISSTTCSCLSSVPLFPLVA